MNIITLDAWLTMDSFESHQLVVTPPSGEYKVWTVKNKESGQVDDYADFFEFMKAMNSHGVLVQFCMPAQKVFDDYKAHIKKRGSR